MVTVCCHGQREEFACYLEVSKNSENILLVHGRRINRYLNACEKMEDSNQRAN